MNIPRVLAAGLAIIGSVVASAAVTAEPTEWADKRLPAIDGMMLWLDASVQPAAAAANDKAPAADGVRREVWYDASGHQRHVRQPNEESRPTLRRQGEFGSFRFDGRASSFSLTNIAPPQNDLTIFLVAAPASNEGNFRGLLSLRGQGEDDFRSGLNIDLGPNRTASFDTINAEGAGFGGFQNLRTLSAPFLAFHRLCLVSSVAGRGVALYVDGQLEATRPRSESSLRMDELIVGARSYGGLPTPRGFFAGEIAEIIVYDRVLTPQERQNVDNYLAAKYREAPPITPPTEPPGVIPRVESPPPVQVFVPGFSVRELPLNLTNLNNVKYRPDGSLVALAYNGNVWILRDTNGDRLEDSAHLFWENKIDLRAPIGMDITPPGYERGDGVFVIGKTRCLLIVDTDGDDRADKEIDVAERWKESLLPVDGLGVAFDSRDGSLYYGRGSYNYTDPLNRDKNGKAQYRLTDESGAVIRVSPDFKQREIIATGIRFPVGMRLNARGDLFVTDQEGATWVPNGNPFDELLHIQRDRHYGFPPRHPTHLPGVIDEPSTFDFTPQHQSTCGLNFNEPAAPGGPVFGPAAWQGDAIVAGYSRGKLYRTQLAKSGSDYVARTHLLACLNMLTVDACVGPRGELVVACHSGGPDWGSGPTGAGKLFKIEYQDHNLPQPVFAWCAGLRELRVEFDRSVDPKMLHDVLGQSKLTAGQFARAGDRFESLWPGYAIVESQRAAPRFDVPLRSAQLTPDGRTLVLATDPMTRAVHYALTLPGMGRPTAQDAATGALPQHPAIDLDFDLSGCDATWTPASGGPAYSVWLPHWDLDVCRQLTAGSAPHDALWDAMERPGELVLRGQLQLNDMLRPAVQPGSKLDYQYPEEIVTVSFDSPTKNAELSLELVQPPNKARSEGSPSTTTRLSPSRHSITLSANAERTVSLALRLRTQGGPPSLTAHWTTNEDDRPRPLPLRRTLVPWADPSGKLSEDLAHKPSAQLEGGSWARGYREFFGEQAACAKCHKLYGRGGSIGPDLSNLVHRDYTSVLRDITHPSFAINPDYLSYNVALTDGRTLTGVLHTTGDAISIGDTKGEQTVVARSDVEEMHPATVSTMPEGIPQQLGPDRMRDLLTFLLTPPPQMPRDFAGPHPKTRTLAEVDAVLAGAPNPPQATRPIRIVLVAGPKDHGAGEHDYPAWQRAWAELLPAAAGVEVATAWEWPAKDEFQRADVIVFYQRGDWNAARAADIDAFLKRGGGLVYIHWAVDGREFGHEFAKRIGLAAIGASGYRHGEIRLDFNRETNHPIIRNFDTLTLIDETYWKLSGALPPKNTLAVAIEESAPHPQLWTMEHGPGRVFVSIPGHYSWTFDDPVFRVLLLRGIAWAAGEPVDRFNELVLPGARVAEIK